MLKKFNYLAEEIINIKGNQFDFNKTGLITSCSFNIIDKNNNPVSIIANITEDDISFQNITNKETYSEKEFMMKYYNYYNDFKQAFSNYENNLSKAVNNIDTSIKINDNTKNSEDTVKIKKFKDVLNNVEQTDNGVKIKIKLSKNESFNFIYKFIEDDNLENLITCNFSFEHQLKIRLKNELFAYDAIALFKQINNSLKLIKINLYDPENLSSTNPIEILSVSQFKEKFKTVYFALIQSSQKFLEKINENYHQLY